VEAGRNKTETVKPKDAIEWIWVVDVTHLVWEMRRLRSMRDGLFERKIAQGLCDVVHTILSADYDWDEPGLMGASINTIFQILYCYKSMSYVAKKSEKHDY
jgi:hypothetical protein